MTTSTKRPRPSRCRRVDERRGAVLPFIAIMLPVMIMLCGFAINLAYMQLTRTELKIATDAAARAGGRAWSETQQVSQAKLFARRAAARNEVAGAPLRLRTRNSFNEIEFGLSTRTGNGRFSFTKTPTNQVANGTADANSIRIVGKRTPGSLNGPVNLLIGGVGTTTQFTPQLQSTCIQLDRDVAIVLDRSGSMAYSTDDYLIFDMLEDLLIADKISDDEFYDCLAGIEDDEVEEAYPGIRTGSYNVYDRFYTENVLTLLDTDPDLPVHFTAEQIANVKAYGEGINDYNDSSLPMAERSAPPFSRWDILGDAVDAFFAVFEDSPQQEQASLGSFSSSGTLESNLVDGGAGYSQVSNIINGYTEIDPITGDETYHPGIRPSGGTSIGSGMQETIPTLIGDGENPAPGARPFAAKTVVVMTDGRQNTNPSPETVAQDIVDHNNVRIHTVTFTPQADQVSMKEVARIGGGEHYHANTASELIAIFEEIANNLPTTMIE